MLFVSFSRLNDGNVFHQTFRSLWNVVAIHLAGTEIDGTIYVIIECWWLDVSCYRFSFHIFTNGSVSQTSNKQWFWTMFPIAIETRLFTIPRCPKIDWMDFSNWNNTLSSIRSCQKSGFCGLKKKTFSSDSKLLLIHVITFCRTFEFPFSKASVSWPCCCCCCYADLFSNIVLPWDRNIFVTCLTALKRKKNTIWNEITIQILAYRIYRLRMTDWEVFHHVYSYQCLFVEYYQHIPHHSQENGNSFRQARMK